MAKTPLDINSIAIDSHRLPVRVFIATVPLLDPSFKNLEDTLCKIIEYATL
jgi:hypothetical protein